MQVLFDSDFILSLLVAEESTHKDAVNLYRFISSNIENKYVLPYVHYEVVTVASRKFGISNAIMVHEFISTQMTRFKLENIEEGVWQEFFSHKKKKISFVDCANLVAAKKYGFKIASFDKFYPKNLRLS